MKDLVQQLNDLRKLEDGWDSYSGKKPSAASIDAALRFVDTMIITASPDGHACLVVGDCGLDIEIEFDDNGQAWPVVSVEAGT